MKYVLILAVMLVAASTAAAASCRGRPMAAKACPMAGCQKDACDKACPMAGCQKDACNSCQKVGCQRFSLRGLLARHRCCPRRQCL